MRQTVCGEKALETCGYSPIEVYARSGATWYADEDLESVYFGIEYHWTDIDDTMEDENEYSDHKTEVDNESSYYETSDDESSDGEMEVLQQKTLERHRWRNMRCVRRIHMTRPKVATKRLPNYRDEMNGILQLLSGLTTDPKGRRG